MNSINEISLLTLLPSNLLEDEQVIHSAKAIDKMLKDVSESVEKIILLPKIDSLNENIIDILAEQFDTPFYDYQLPLDTKKELVKNSINWHKKLGTKSAMKEILETIYGGAIVEEWFQYGGEPYHFIVFVNDDKLKINGIRYGNAELRRIINSVKNTRSWLDFICYYSELEATVNIGSVISEYTLSILNDSIERAVTGNIIVCDTLSSYEVEELPNTVTQTIKSHLRTGSAVVQIETEVIR